MLWMCVPVLLLFLPATGFFGWILLSALATFRVDPQGITRISLGQQTQFIWREIVDFQSGPRGQFGTVYHLTDSIGRKLNVTTGLMERGYGLEGFIDAYLAPVREQKRAQFQMNSQVFHYGRAIGIIMLL